MDAPQEWNEGYKNRWRYKAGSDEKIIEMELTRGYITQIDSHRWEDVRDHRWCTSGTSHGSNVRYAQTQITPEGGKKRSLAMHALLFPDITPPRDHIDCNGLNNLAANIRSGANSLNERNRSKKREDDGVRLRNEKYIAVWREKNGRSREKGFPISKYPTKEAAYEAAVSCRKQNAERVIKEIEEINATDPTKGPEKYVPATQKTASSGIKHVTIAEAGTNRYRAIGHVKINDKSFYKVFAISKYNGDVQRAVSDAREWVEQIKLDNPKLPRKKQRTGE